MTAKRKSKPLNALRITDSEGLMMGMKQLITLEPTEAQ